MRFLPKRTPEPEPVAAEPVVEAPVPEPKPRPARDEEAAALEAFVKGLPFGYPMFSPMWHYVNGHRPRDDAERAKFDHWRRLGLPRQGSTPGSWALTAHPEMDDDFGPARGFVHDVEL